MPNRLQTTYAKYKLEALQLQKALSDIRTKMMALEEAGATDNDGETLLALGAPVPQKDGGGGTMTSWVENIINSLPPGSRMRRIEVEKALFSAGYKANGEHFDVTLFKTLLRLQKSGRIGGVKDGGKWWFFPQK